MARPSMSLMSTERAFCIASKPRATVVSSASRSLTDSVRVRSTLFREAVSSRLVAVPGSPRAERLDGRTQGDSPVEPQTLVMIFATTRDELVTLSIRSWPRDDLAREVERIVDSFEIIQP